MTATLRGASVAHARRALAERFRAAGIESPELDARILTGHALGLDHAGLASAASQQISDLTAAQIERFAVRRVAGEPVARILGEKEFWSLPLTVTHAVLVPRPETETVVELALDLLDRDGARARALRIADLATGSGAILLALLSELPNAHGLGTDIDAEALAVARANAQRLGFAGRATFLAGDYGAPLGGWFDLIVSNPPYVASSDIATLAPEVRDHDPRHALDGGADGLGAYRAIAADTPRLLKQSGYLVIEIGAAQERAVGDLFARAGLAITAARPDLSGITRAMAAKLR
ncbi:MAG: peptide chain release factor N(5)-glutamine methyltransferase [Alphaproteobacteria bacterium]|nr:MAG: peptide chain release factor N(5)-glutamine methyltransferase [Alphaproteobacteria bacterium]